MVHHQLVGLLLAKQNAHFAELCVPKQLNFTDATLFPLLGLGCEAVQFATTEEAE